MVLERGSPCRRLKVLEPAREVERLRLEDRELLLNRDREVRRGLEASARLRDQLVRRDTLFLTHEPDYSS